MSKLEHECSHAIQEAFKDAFTKNLDNYNQMKEFVYHTLPGGWLRKTFPGVIFDNSNIPEKHSRVFLKEEEISELPENPQDILT